ncbi:AMP-binding protein, partial [Lentzea sp. NPDC060358]|uniref:AMP-binding protein n=1 Tax=Lentzea sp. NPDC060358 TaxID=3347103 RepID=UPI0036587D46
MFRETALLDLSPADRALFREFGAGPVRTPPFDRVHHAVEACAARHPLVTAVEHGGHSLTYGELDARASLLAELLVRRGVRTGEHVGLFLSRSTWLAVGVLAVLKAGAVCVLQDAATTPEHELRHVVRAARVDLVLTTTADRLPEHLAEVVAVDALPDRRPLHRTPTAEPDLAAALVTPGGVVRLSHATLCNLLLTAPGSLGIGPGTRVAQLLHLASVPALWEVLGTLVNGGTLVLRGDDPGRVASTADVVIATPNVLESLDPDACRGVRTVAVTGERCPPALAQEWSRHAEFLNACGRTELGGVTTVDRHEPGSGAVTIGRPVPNTTVYVLDEHRRPCPIGVIGEMWAGGACVGEGRAVDDLTARRYRPDPFLGGDHVMVRTRDLVRWTGDGRLEHHGRAGDLVVVRGFPVALNAVTAALETAARRATTLVHDGTLIAFVSPATTKPDTARRAVARRLPYYCVPSLVVAVDALPATGRGKVDR